MGYQTQPLNTFGAGDHRLVSAKGLDSGIDVDSIQLKSVPSVTFPGSVTPPSTTVTSTGTNSYKVDISEASAPFWLVLGQSLSDGWKATVRGGPSLGAPTLIDGFANGWLVDPGLTGATFTVDITWAPQKIVWAGLAISSPWFIGLCLCALVVAWRRRRFDRVLVDATNPILVSSELPNATSTSERLGLLLGITALSALIGGFGVAITMAIIASLSLWTRRRVAITTLAVLGSIGGIVVLYTGLQFRHEYRTGVEWPSGFWFAHQLGLLAVLVVVSETVTRRFVRKRSDSRSNPIIE